MRRVGRRLATTLAAVGVIGVGGLGCTNTLFSSDRVVPEGPLTHAEFVEAANAACLREMLGTSGGGDLGAALDGDVESVLSDILWTQRDIADAQVKALRLLPVPAGEEEQVEAILDAFDALVAHLDEAIEAGGIAALEEMADPAGPDVLSSLIVWRGALLEDYGITGCG